VGRAQRAQRAASRTTESDDHASRSSTGRNFVSPRLDWTLVSAAGLGLPPSSNQFGGAVSVFLLEIVHGFRQRLYKLSK
jgi:hypothetical protein